MNSCTACHRQLWYSHRRGDQGRMLSAIGMVEKIS
ncbi:MAG: laccase domain-containing protein [Terriglobales bacterium]